MSQVTTSLDEITTAYSIFEKDQVLTHDQLNSVASYFEDQTRLTRTKLLGVGIVCGLRVSLQGNSVKLSKGAGITTDGDLLQTGDIVFDQFKPYDESSPVYAPFYVNNALIKLFELVPAGTSDPRAAALSSFAAQTGSSLESMAAVLFMEGYVKDEDLCSGTDCDNLGKDCVNTLKLLLVEQGSVDALRKNVPTPSQAASALGEIVADRPFFAPTIATGAQLAASYRAVCGTIHGKLIAELPKLYPNCAFFLTEAFAADPAPGWIARLNALKASFASNDFGIQYYYDFLKDLAETYNHFRDLLFDDATWCCPDPETFAKHLLLGGLAAGGNSNAGRTGFYPSPLASRTSDQLGHAQFLAGKIDILIQTFQVPAAPAAIRITPSQFEDAPLDERAIPYYYRINAATPVQKNWNYRLSRRGLDSFNFSYNAASYGAQGAAANPLASQLGRFAFFRIEGHIGQPVKSAQQAIEKEIATKNLPLAVRSVLLGSDKSKIVKNPGVLHYSDLHRFHYLLRQAVSHQLEDVVNFSQNFKQKVDVAVRNNVITDSQNDPNGTTLKNVAKDQNASVARNASTVRAKLNRGYSAYKSDSTWKQNVAPAMEAAGQFKSRLTDVVKTEFSTPFDGLIGNTHIQWIDWLDDIIRAKDDEQDSKLLFSTFVAENPGIAHCGGALRGGTLVLVYDQSQAVVADFMLPYHSAETVAPEPAEPPLRKPELRPRSIVGSGITVLPSRDKFVRDKLSIFTAGDLDTFVRGKLDGFKAASVDGLEQKLDAAWNEKFNSQQKDYFGTIKDSWITMAGAISKISTGTKVSLNDSLLDAAVNETKARQQRIQLLREKSVDTGLAPEIRDKFAKQAKDAEADLAKSIQSTAEYISDAGVNVSSGSDGFRAMMEVSNAIGTLTDSAAKTSLKSGLTRLQGTTGNAGLKVMLGNLASF